MLKEAWAEVVQVVEAEVVQVVEAVAGGRPQRGWGTQLRPRHCLRPGLWLGLWLGQPGGHRILHWLRASCCSCCSLLRGTLGWALGSSCCSWRGLRAGVRLQCFLAGNRSHVNALCGLLPLRSSFVCVSLLTIDSDAMQRFFALAPDEVEVCARDLRHDALAGVGGGGISA